MHIQSLDHLVLTVQDVQASCDFYQRVLGMEVVSFSNGRTALHFGTQKINLHPATHPFKPHAECPQPGSADLCFVVADSVVSLCAELEGKGIEVLSGPVTRTGAVGPITSVYLRDPDRNLIELCSYTEGEAGAA